MAKKTDKKTSKDDKKHRFKILTKGLDKGRHFVYSAFRNTILFLWPHLIRHKKLYPYLNKTRHGITEKRKLSPRQIKPGIKGIGYTVLAIILAILCFILWQDWHSASKKDNEPKKRDPAVVTAPVVQKDVPVFLPALGTVIPLKTINIKAQVNGQFLKVHFKDGKMVKKGDLLAEIDDRPFKALLIQYEGQLARRPF